MGTLVSSLGSVKGWCGFAVALRTNWRLAVARKSMSQRLIRDCRRDSVRFKDSPPLVSVDGLAWLNAGPTSKKAFTDLGCRLTCRSTSGISP